MTRSVPSDSIRVAARHGVRGQHAVPVDLSDGRRVEPRDRARRRDPVRRRQLRRVQLARVPHLVVVEEVRRPGHRVTRHRAGRGERLDELADRGIVRRRGWQQGRDARLERFRQPDPPFEPERARDLVGEEPADRATGDPPHDLSGDPAVGAHVVPGGRLVPVPARRLRRELVHHGEPGQRGLEREFALDHRQPGPVGEHRGAGGCPACRSPRTRATRRRRGCRERSARAR